MEESNISTAILEIDHAIRLLVEVNHKETAEQLTNIQQELFNEIPNEVRIYIKGLLEHLNQ